MARVRKREGLSTIAAAGDDVPKLFGRYSVEAVLGRGGVGAVYRALDPVSGERVALKTLELQQPHALALFEREYQTLASIAHPAVVRTFDYGVADDGIRYYTMELIEGDDLYALMPLPWRALCVHLQTVAEALALLHARGLVHRDVSPRNIRIDKKGQARLLDFGALAQIGPVTDIVGTPACIAPEALSRGVLDARSDLFSLGATAYFALSGHKPYALTAWEDASAAFAVAPRPLSEQLQLPAALNDLVVRLLQIDPARRPDSAADVIEYLGSLDGSIEARESDAGGEQLTSTALIGREREVEQLREHLAQAFKGHGTAVVIEGPSGIGKSRLAQQLLVDARVLGAVAVRAEAGSKQLSAGAHHQVMRALLAAAPSEAEACLAREPMAAAWLEAAQREPKDLPLGMRRDASGTQLGSVVRCVRALSQQRVLVIVVEDVQSLDSASAAVLFGLAHSIDTMRIVLVLTLGNDAALDPTLDRIVRICSQIKLRQLSPQAIDALIASIFGQVDHRTRLARWIESLAGGNPGHSLDLLEALVRRRIIRRLSGSWSIPGELPEQQLPASLEDALNTVLETLDRSALELVRSMALHNGSMPLALCAALQHRSEQELRTVCDRLVAERVVTAGPAGYRIAHAGWRKALLAALTETELVRLHRTLAEALLAQSGLSPVATLGARLQAGWHLLHGGQTARGRELLRTAGIQLTRHGEGLSDALPALESALSAFGNDSASHYERLGLMVPLTLAGTYIDWRLTYKYGLPLLDGLIEATGLQLAAKLAKTLPKRVALVSALGYGALRMPLSERRVIAHDYRELMLGLLGLASAALGSLASLADKKTAEHVMQRLEPLSWFPTRHPAAVAYRLQRALAAVAAGRYADAYEEALEVQAWLQHPDGVRGMPDDARRQFTAGLHVLTGTIDAYRADNRMLRSIQALEREGTPSALESIAGFRANYHANRGEMALHRSAREELDVLAAHGGSPWRQDVLVPRCLWWIQVQCEDALGLKRSIRQLESISRECEGMISTHAAAHGCYLIERGLTAEALQRYEPTLAAAARDCSILHARVAAAYARMLRRAGRAQAALDLCSKTLARFRAAERELVCFVHGLEVEMGLALADTGDLSAAAAYLDQLCSAQRTHDNPLLHALSHVARAEVAVLQADRATFAEHEAQAERWVAQTHYAALFGLLQRLHGRALTAGLTPDVTLAPPGADTRKRAEENGRAILASIAACRGDVERQQLALDVLIEQTRAASGYLYLFGASGLRLVAPHDGAEPPDALQAELEARVSDWHDMHTEATVARACEPLQTLVGGDAKRDPIGGLEAKLGSPYRVVMLVLPSQRMVGVAALIEGSQTLLAMPAAISEAIAQGIYQAGDATIMR